MPLVAKFAILYNLILFLGIMLLISNVPYYMEPPITMIVVGMFLLEVFIAVVLMFVYL